MITPPERNAQGMQELPSEIFKFDVKNHWSRLVKLGSVQSIPMIFRCDALTDEGWGRFRRCYALAEVAQQSGRFRVHFLSRALPKSLKKKVSEIHANLQTLPEGSTYQQDLAHLHSMFDMMSRKRVIVVVDHADYESEGFKSLRSDQRVILLAIDDGEKKHYDADFLINPNLDAELIAYSTSPDCQRLLGPKFTMIRDEVHTLRQDPTERMAENFQFLVSLGMSDHWGHAMKAIEAVRRSTHRFETHVIVPTDWPHAEAAKRLIGNHPRVHLYEDPSFMPQLLARSDLALVASGHLTYELAYLGVPMLSVSMNSSQVSTAEAWSTRGISDYIGDVEKLTPELIMEKILYWMERDQDLEERGIASQRVIDGRGKFRALEKLTKLLQNITEGKIKLGA